MVILQEGESERFVVMARRARRQRYTWKVVELVIGREVL
jgi:hypothetical protein